MSDPDTFLFVRRGVLQFVILKPLLAVLIMILKVAGLYEEGYVAWGSSYVYLSFAYNLSVCWSMYCLVLFYVQCSRDLKPYRQGLLLAILVASGAIRDGESEEYSANNISLALQDALICFEMPFFSWLHLYAFPWTDYDDSRLSSRLTLRYAIRDALGIKDLVQDTYATFVDPPDFSHPLPGRRRRQVRQHVDADHWIDNAENDLPDDDDGEDYVGGIGGRRYDVEAGGPGRARRNDSYDDITPVAASERTRFAAGPRGRLYLGDDAVDGSLALDFAAPDDEEENDYAQARELVFGDFNFPVMHEDPRFHHPPEVRRLIEHHATTFLERVASAGSRTDLSPALAQASGPAARAGGNGLLHPSSAAAGGGLREFLLSDDDDDDLAIMGAEFGDEDNADDDSALLTAHHRSAAGGVGRIPPRSQMGTTKQVVLRDGRALAYWEWLCPAWARAQDAGSAEEPLHTVLLFSGIPGSRLFSHPLVAKHEPLGIRLISVDRPGLGLSTPQPGRTILDMADDVEELLDQIGLERVSVIGYSAGGPYALATAFRLPHRVTRVAIVSSVSPRQAPKVYTGMPVTYRLAWFFAAHAPWLLGTIVRLSGSTARADPVAYHRQDVDAMPESDRPIATSPEVEAMFVESIVETFGREQDAVMAHEYGLWGKPWGFDLADIKAPVRVWHGAKDTGATLPMGQYIAARIGCDIVVDPEAGHMLYFTVFKDIIAWICDAS
nr:hypothetical protein HK105_005048 [Polyrhizophydium stewartii]